MELAADFNAVYCRGFHISSPVATFEALRCKFINRFEMGFKVRYRRSAGGGKRKEWQEKCEGGMQGLDVALITHVFLPHRALGINESSF